MTTYKPDTCDCVIEIESQNFTKRCNLHKKAKDINEVLEHNRGFNRTKYNDDKKINRKLCAEAKRAERERIKAIK